MIKQEWIMPKTSGESTRHLSQFKGAFQAKYDKKAQREKNEKNQRGLNDKKLPHF